MQIPFSFNNTGVSASIAMLETKNETKLQQFVCNLTIGGIITQSIQTDKISAFGWLYAEIKRSKYLGLHKGDLIPTYTVCNMDILMEVNNVLASGVYLHKFGDSLSLVIAEGKGCNFKLEYFGTHLFQSGELEAGFRQLSSLIADINKNALIVSESIMELYNKLYSLE